jgi:hypothetical protein
MRAGLFILGMTAIEISESILSAHTVLQSFSALAESSHSCLETMQALVEKFPEGCEGWAEEKGEDPAPPPPRLSPAFGEP